jgi:hypothetical protein
MATVYYTFITFLVLMFSASDYASEGIFVRPSTAEVSAHLDETQRPVTSRLTACRE